MRHSEQHGGHSMRGGAYRRFALMLVLSFASMYVLMYAMVNRVENALPNNNQLFMAGLMTAAMAIIELALMGGMYPNKRANLLGLALAVLALVGCWVAIRRQATISDKQFLKSMIPHHAGAILMCNEARIADPEIERLCGAIRSSQQSEIAQMKAILERLDRR